MSCVIHDYVTIGKLVCSIWYIQWRSQDAADARAQHGHTTFVRSSMQNAEESRGVWGHAPPENLGIFLAFQVGSEAILGHTVALNQVHFPPCIRCGCVCDVKSLH